MWSCKVLVLAKADILVDSEDALLGFEQPNRIVELSYRGNRIGQLLLRTLQGQPCLAILVVVKPFAVIVILKARSGNRKYGS